LEIAPTETRKEFDQVLGSAALGNSQFLCRFLEFVTGKMLEGEQKRSADTAATEAFARQS